MLAQTAPSPVRTHRRVGCTTRPSSVAVQASCSSSGAQLQGVLVCKRMRKELVRSIRQASSSTSPRYSTGTTEALPALIKDLRRKMELHTVSGDVINRPAQASAGRVAVVAAATAPAPTLSKLTVALPVGWDDDEEEQPVFEPRDYTVPGRVLVCQGSKCRAKGALGVLQAVSAVTSGSETVEVLPCKCLGMCKQGAAMRIKQQGVAKAATYARVDASQVPDILDAHFAAPAQH